MSLSSACLFAAVLSGTLLVGSVFQVSNAAEPETKPVAGPAGERLFELRTYYCHPGKLADLHKRFSDHTNKLFVKHGMELIGYWTPSTGDESQDTLIYILAYPSKEAREKSWAAFQADPAWKTAKTESEKAGPILRKVESKLLSPTAYSPIK